MIIIITESQLEFIESKRKLLGQGMQHRVYTLYDVSGAEFENKNVIVKIGYPADVKTQVNFFSSFPNYFPQVYKSGIFVVSDEAIEKNKLYHDVDTGNTMGYVYLERLNTEEFLRKHESILNKLDDNIKRDFEELGFNFDPTLVNNVRNNLVKNNATNEDLIFYDELTNLMSDIINEGLKIDKDAYLDLHSGNFGIDKNGKIKCLDF